MEPFFVQAEPHWGGDVAEFTGRLNVEVSAQADAKNLAAIRAVLDPDGTGQGDPQRLARLADLARRILAEDAAERDPVLA